MRREEKGKKSGGRKDRRIREGAAGAEGVGERRNNKLQSTFPAERDRTRELLMGGGGGVGGLREALL